MSAHLHLLVNHIPLFGLIGGIILLIFSLLKNNLELKKYTIYYLSLLGAFAVLANFTGEESEDVVEDFPNVSHSYIEEHEDFAEIATIGTVILSVLSIAILVIKKTDSNLFLKILLFLAFVNFGTMAWTANLGGKISHPELRSANPIQDVKFQEKTNFHKDDEDDD